MQLQEGERPRYTARASISGLRRVVAVTLGAAAIAWVAAGPSAQHAQHAQQDGQGELGLKFRAQEIASNFGVGYAVATGDVNRDGRVDILAISGTELAWFENPTWAKHVILGRGATVADNVALAAHDIDGDGRLDVALAAGWGGQNSGTLQWARQGASGEPWQVYPIHAESTMHRIGWADVTGDGRPELIGAPLHGAGGQTGTGGGARLLVFTVPANPQTETWPLNVADSQNNIMHNFTVMKSRPGDAQDTLVTASREGLFAIRREANGSWTRTQVGQGNPGEVSLGVVDGRRMLATVEPWHGAGVAVYAEQPTGLWAKTTIGTTLTEGHALGWGDFNGDGRQELAVGWRSGPGAGVAVYAVSRDGQRVGMQPVEVGVTGLPAGRRGGGQGGGSSAPPQGMDTEALVVVDLDGNGRPDIVAAGRNTRNVKIYWNETP